MEETPPILYHYTSLRGLMGIIRERGLWFSDVRFLNDKREFQHACDMLKFTITEGVQHYRPKWIERGLSAVMFDQMTRSILAQCNHESMYQTIARHATPFVFCLTSADDSLSQWTRYGAYCIGFDTSMLRSLASLGKIVYCQHKTLLPEVGSDLVKFFEDKLWRVDPADLVPGSSLGGRDDIIAKYLQNETFFKYKTLEFSQEEEWRMFTKRSISDPGVFFDDQRGSLPRPRITLRGGTNENLVVDAIREVISGPEVDAARATQSLELVKQNFRLSFNIRHSVVPYRSD